MYKNTIREIRKEKGITMEKLAETVGISIGYLCHLEKGTRTNPSVKIMNKMAKALGKPVSEIFFIDEN